MQGGGPMRDNSIQQLEIKFQEYNRPTMLYNKCGLVTGWKVYRLWFMLYLSWSTQRPLGAYMEAL